MPTCNDRLISPVPAQVISLARTLVTAYDGRVAEFNIAAWLQLKGLENLPVSLMVRYLDGEQAREIAVEHSKVGAQGKVLLSGVARLGVKQNLQNVQVFLRTAVPAQCMLVEELFVQAVEPAKNDKRQALA
jgi:hypothetical protein